MSEEINGTLTIPWGVDEERFLELYERRKAKAKLKLDPIPSQMDYLREVLGLALPCDWVSVHPEGERDLPLKIQFEPEDPTVEVYEGPIDLDNS